MQRIIDYDAAEPGTRGNGVGYPCIFVDSKTGTLFVAALWSRGNRFWHGSGPGLTPDETGQLVIVKSDDDGPTWSKPVSITPQVKDPAWKLCFQEPGSGIQLSDGTLIFPTQFKGAGGIPHSCFISSIDHGTTWTISRAAIPGKQPTSESSIAEMGDGLLLLSMRDELNTGRRLWARWNWKGQLNEGQWSEPWSAVTDPTCMASLLHHPHDELLLLKPQPRKEAGGSDDSFQYRRGQNLERRQGARPRPGNVFLHDRFARWPGRHPV